jgi:hypothetical protein
MGIVNGGSYGPSTAALTFFPRICRRVLCHCNKKKKRWVKQHQSPQTKGVAMEKNKDNYSQRIENEDRTS